MKNKLSLFITRHKILTTILGVFFVAITSWSIINAIPHPLNDDFAYLGKEDYGNIFGFDSTPHSVFYYGTNLSEDDFRNSFSVPTDEDVSDILEDGYTGRDFTFNPGSTNSFSITFYKDGNKAFRGNHGYSHVISILDENYSKAKTYLKK